MYIRCSKLKNQLILHERGKITALTFSAHVYVAGDRLYYTEQENEPQVEEEKELL